MAGNDTDTFAEELMGKPFPVVYLDFRSVDRFLYRIRDLPELPDSISQELLERLDQCHIYMICKRPRLSVVPGSISWNVDSVRLKLSCTSKGAVFESDVRMSRTPELRRATIFCVSSFPHRELLAIDDAGAVVGQMLFANLAHTIDSLPAVAKQLEVLYIGKGLSNNTQDRLANHATLQRVIANINSDDPDCEVFALVYRFDYRRSVTGIVSGIPGDEMRKFLAQAKPYTPTIEDRVSLVEAAAISYFHTAEYNIQYINFPATDTEAARRAREAGASYLVVQIDTENIGDAPLCSQSVHPAATHHIVRSIAR